MRQFDFPSPRTPLPPPLPQKKSTKSFSLHPPGVVDFPFPSRRHLTERASSGVSGLVPHLSCHFNHNHRRLACRGTLSPWQHRLLLGTGTDDCVIMTEPGDEFLCGRAFTLQRLQKQTLIKVGKKQLAKFLFYFYHISVCDGNKSHQKRKTPVTLFKQRFQRERGIPLIQSS